MSSIIMPLQVDAFRGERPKPPRPLRYLRGLRTRSYSRWSHRLALHSSIVLNHWEHFFFSSSKMLKLLLKAYRDMEQNSEDSQGIRKRVGLTTLFRAKC